MTEAETIENEGEAYALERSFCGGAGFGIGLARLGSY